MGATGATPTKVGPSFKRFHPGVTSFIHAFPDPGGRLFLPPLRRWSGRRPTFIFEPPGKAADREREMLGVGPASVTVVMKPPPESSVGDRTMVGWRNFSHSTGAVPVSRCWSCTGWVRPGPIAPESGLGFASDFTVISADLPGHGESLMVRPVPAVAASPDAVCAELDANGARTGRHRGPRFAAQPPAGPALRSDNPRPIADLVRDAAARARSTARTG